MVLDGLGADSFIKAGVGATYWFQNRDPEMIHRPGARATPMPETGCDGEKLIAASYASHQPPAASRHLSGQQRHAAGYAEGARPPQRIYSFLKQ